MPPIRGITVCVQYDDLLKITLPRNAKHLSEIVVVTTEKDLATQAVVATVPNARCFFTDAFYRQGAKFNKGLAMEEGFDALGRQGWILVWDADTLLPPDFNLGDVSAGNLYGANRRMLAEPKEYSDTLDWDSLPLRRDVNEFPGFFQLFHADDPVLRAKPWYGVDWKHAGGCDSVFQARWTGEHKHLIGQNVLHLGLEGRNWFGRVTDRVDGQEIADKDIRQADMMAMREARKENYRGGGKPDERLGPVPSLPPAPLRAKLGRRIVTKIVSKNRRPGR